MKNINFKNRFLLAKMVSKRNQNNITIKYKILWTSATRHCKLQLPPSCTETLHRLHRLNQPSAEVLICVQLLLLFDDVSIEGWQDRGYTAIFIWFAFFNEIFYSSCWTSRFQSLVKDTVKSFTF